MARMRTLIFNHAVELLYAEGRQPEYLALLFKWEDPEFAEAVLTEFFGLLAECAKLYVHGLDLLSPALRVHARHDAVVRICAWHTGRRTLDYEVRRA